MFCTEYSFDYYSVAVQCVYTQTVGDPSLHDETVFVCQLVRKKYMERNLNSELINAKHSEYIKCAQCTSAQGHLIFNSFLVTHFDNV